MAEQILRSTSLNEGHPSDEHFSGILIYHTDKYGTWLFSPV
jgi:hypothetical protein